VKAKQIMSLVKDEAFTKEMLTVLLKETELERRIEECISLAIRESIAEHKLKLKMQEQVEILKDEIMELLLELDWRGV